MELHHYYFRKSNHAMPWKQPGNHAELGCFSLCPQPSTFFSSAALPVIFFIPLFKRWFVSLQKNEESQSPFIGVRLYRCNHPGRSDGPTSRSQRVASERNSPTAAQDRKEEVAGATEVDVERMEASCTKVALGTVQRLADQRRR